MIRGSRRHDWVCWGIIVGSWIAAQWAGGQGELELRRLSVTLKLDLPRPRPPPAAERLLQVLVAAVLAALVLAVIANRRARACMRIRPRLSRPSEHGDAYHEAFALDSLLCAAWTVLVLTLVRDWRMPSLLTTLAGYLS